MLRSSDYYEWSGAQAAAGVQVLGLKGSRGLPYIARAKTMRGELVRCVCRPKERAFRFRWSCKAIYGAVVSQGFGAGGFEAL